MKLNYAGKTKEFTAEEQVKLDNRLHRLGKLVERKGERVAHVAIKSTRHLHRAEIAMRFKEQPVVGIASAPDLYQAVSAAVDKLEKQILKLHEKYRELRRAPQGKVVRNGAAAKAAVSAAAAAPPAAVKPNGLAAVVAEAKGRTVRAAKVYRVDGHKRMKPMTLDEAMLEIGRNQDYYSYPDAETGKTSVLIRRADGHFDLVEG